MIKVSVREAKLVLDRILMLAGLELGLIPSVRELLISAQTVGADAFQFVHDELLKETYIDRLTIEYRRNEAGSIDVDCREQVAPLVAPQMLGLICAQVALQGSVAVNLREIRYPELVLGIVPHLTKKGIVSTVIAHSDRRIRTAVGLGKPTFPSLVGELNPGSSTNNEDTDVLYRSDSQTFTSNQCIVIASAGYRSSESPVTRKDSALGLERWMAIVRGIEVEPNLWWSLYHRSNDALTPTSEVSRRHAGPSVDKLYVEF